MGGGRANARDGGSSSIRSQDYDRLVWQPTQTQNYKDFVQDIAHRRPKSTTSPSFLKSLLEDESTSKHASAPVKLQATDSGVDVQGGRGLKAVREPGRISEQPSQNDGRGSLEDTASLLMNLMVSASESSSKNIEDQRKVVERNLVKARKRMRDDHSLGPSASEHGPVRRKQKRKNQQHHLSSLSAQVAIEDDSGRSSLPITNEDYSLDHRPKTTYDSDVPNYTSSRQSRSKPPSWKSEIANDVSESVDRPQMEQSHDAGGLEMESRTHLSVELSSSPPLNTFPNAAEGNPTPLLRSRQSSTASVFDLPKDPQPDRPIVPAIDLQPLMQPLPPPHPDTVKPIATTHHRKRSAPPALGMRPCSQSKFILPSAAGFAAQKKFKVPFAKPAQSSRTNLKAEGARVLLPLLEETNLPENEATSSAQHDTALFLSQNMGQGMASPSPKARQDDDWRPPRPPRRASVSESDSRAGADRQAVATAVSTSGHQLPGKAEMKVERSPSPCAEADDSFTSNDFDMGVDEDELEKACSMFD